jgi:penicillin-insensitive murein endopeptidase
MTSLRAAVTACLGLASIGLALPLAAASAEPAAQALFGGMSLPSATLPAAIGSYAKGCLAGAVTLPAEGPGWQAMRPSRNRAWGHPRLVAWVESFAASLLAQGWPGILVGDLSQPRGGPMRSGHASHQIGLDADIWLTPMPDRLLAATERETVGAESVIHAGTHRIDAQRFGPAQAAMIRTAASSPDVARIFVAPGIKAALCEAATGDSTWLRKVRPWWGHQEHFHVRLACPPGEASCVDQAPPPPGDGCGEELAWWFTTEPWTPKPVPPPKPVLLADLPDQCRAVLAAPAPPPATLPAAAQEAGGQAISRPSRSQVGM